MPGNLDLMNFDAFDGDIVELDDSGLNDIMEVIEDLVPGAEVSVVAPGKDDKPAKLTSWEEDGDHSKFLDYGRKYLENIPSHSGQTTVGCERAIAYIKRFIKEVSRAVQSDVHNKIDEEECEKLLDTGYEYIAKLEDALDKLISKKTERFKKKSAVKIANEVVSRINDGVSIKYYISVDDGEGEELLPVTLAEPSDEQVQIFALGDADGLTKEAGTAKIYLFEDPFLHAITRLLINSQVSAGRDIDSVYDTLKDKYAFTPREELSIQELLLQKGFPIFKDLGRIGEEYDPSDDKGIDFGTTYPA